MCCWIYYNGRSTPLRLVEDAAKDYCRAHHGYTYKRCVEVHAERAARDVEMILRHAEDFNVVDDPQDVIRMLDELRAATTDEYTAAENNTNRARYIGGVAQQPEWYGQKRAEQKREWEYTRILRAAGYNHYFNCRELIQQGVYECKHFNCKCVCHQRANDARAKCLWRSQRGEPHDDCACACHLTA